MHQALGSTPGIQKRRKREGKEREERKTNLKIKNS